MNIGIHLPQYGELAARDPLLTVGHTAEEVGLASIWVSDHLAFPLESLSRYPYSDDGTFPLPFSGPFLETITVLALLAGTTDTIALGTSVLVFPMRNTILAVKQLGTLAAVAPGRLIVGVGAGWLREEFEILGSSFENREQMLNEQIEVLRGLLGTPRFSYKGTLLAFPELLMEPRPPEVPPVWVGGNSPAALQRAGRLGDAWHPVAFGLPKDLHSKYARVCSIAAEAGRSGQVQLTARIDAQATPSYIEHLKPQLDSLLRMGCAHVVVDPVYSSSLDDAVQFCRQLGKVAHAFRA